MGAFCYKRELGLLTGVRPLITYALSPPSSPCVLGVAPTPALLVVAHQRRSGRARTAERELGPEHPRRLACTEDAEALGAGVSASLRGRSSDWRAPARDAAAPSLPVAPAAPCAPGPLSRWRDERAVEDAGRGPGVATCRWRGLSLGACYSHRSQRVPCKLRWRAMSGPRASLKARTASWHA